MTTDSQPEIEDDSRLIPAASVLLLRETPDGGIETLMLRRGQASFAANVWVFPGGGVDDGDRDPRLEAHAAGLTFDAAHARLGGAERRGPLTAAASFGVHAAAIRELLEEVAVALCYGPAGRLVPLDDPATGDRWEAYRHQLLDGSINLVDLLARERATLAFDRLTYYSHWITPRVRSRRYNTHFFLAVMPPNQAHRHHPDEALDSRWLRAETALTLHQRGEFPLITVTRAHLERLAAHGTLDRFMAHARAKSVPAVQGVLVTGPNDSIRERLPAEVADCW